MKKKFGNATLIMIAALMVMFLVISCGNDMDNPTSTGDTGVPQLAPVDVGGEYAADHFLVGFKDGADIQAINAASGAVTLDIIPEIDVHILKVPEGSTVDQMVRRFNRIPGVEFAEPDYIAHATLIPNDPYYPNQWGLPKIQAPRAWDITQGDKKVRIAVLDTGVDFDHEDLASKIPFNIFHKNFTTSSTADDHYGHGTHCAGIAAAITNNDIGVAGNGFDCRLMNGKVLGDSGSGQYSWLAKGIVWATLWRAKVISMSLSGGSPDNTVEKAVNFAWRRGVVLVAAAGNHGTTTPVYPAFYENCIAVGATDQNDNKASFSAYGPDWVDVAAPGVSIFSTFPNHGSTLGKDYGSISGTSMATPFVAGLAGLLWTTGYGTDNATVRARIESTCDPIGLTYWAHGRINDYEAVKP
ncbi:peptidase S8 [bacterium]|nr:peptidase S8 [bacterium]